MALPKRAIAPKRRFFGPVITLLLVAVLSSALAVGTTWALWSVGIISPSRSVNYEPVQIQLLDNTAAVIGTVTSSNSVLTVPFTPDDALVIQDAMEANIAAGGNGNVVWTKLFRVQGATAGTLGFDYSVELPDLSRSHWGRDLMFYPVTDSRGCGALSILAEQPDMLQSYTGISTDYGESKTTTEYWCLAVNFHPETYTNTATGIVEVWDNDYNTTLNPTCTVVALCTNAPTATAPVADTSANDYTETSSWRAGVVIDPRDEPDLAFNIRVTITH
ncbi:MAG: hypothetical protein LBR20_04800 [Propionibacteriaceae bacterium]|jgi:hypothetical protein|nr:hypothetical protein [Propionibacteriaceae bacterium]